MPNSNPPKWKNHETRQSEMVRTIAESGDYLLLGKDSDGRDIYSLKEKPGVYYAIAPGLKMAWRVSAVKPSMEMDPKFKKVHRKNVLPDSLGDHTDGDACSMGRKLKDTDIVFELKAKSLSQAQIASQVGLSVAQVSRILSGKSRSPKVAGN